MAEGDTLTVTQTKALAAARNAQLALAAVENDRVPSLRSKRDSALRAAIASGIPRVRIAEEIGLTEGRVSQLARSNGHRG